MHSFLLNLIIGIIGGIFSGVIVSRVFVILGNLDEQFEVLKRTSYRFGFLMAFFDTVESIMKLSSDTSSEIENGIKNDPNYLKEHDILRTKDVIEKLKTEMLDKTVEAMRNERNDLTLKQEKFLKLDNKAYNIISKFEEIKEFKFSTIDSCRKELDELEKEYELCFKDKGKTLLKLIVSDKTLIALMIVFIAICMLLLLF